MGVGMRIRIITISLLALLLAGCQMQPGGASGQQSSQFDQQRLIEAFQRDDLTVIAPMVVALEQRGRLNDEMLRGLLKVALDDGAVKTVDYLIRKGAPARGLLPRLGVTPLHVAALDGRTDVAQVLVAHGGDVNALDRDGKSSPVNFAVIGLHVDLTRAKPETVVQTINIRKG